MLYVYSAWDNTAKLRAALNPPTYVHLYRCILQQKYNVIALLLALHRRIYIAEILIAYKIVVHTWC